MLILQIAVSLHAKVSHNKIFLKSLFYFTKPNILSNEVVICSLSPWAVCDGDHVCLSECLSDLVKLKFHYYGFNLYFGFLSWNFSYLFIDECSCALWNWSDEELKNYKQCEFVNLSFNNLLLLVESNQASGRKLEAEYSSHRISLFSSSSFPPYNSVLLKIPSNNVVNIWFTFSLKCL